MSDLPPHIEENWEAIERKAQVPGARLNSLLNDIREAVRTSVDWWIKETSIQQLAQADSRENRQRAPVRNDSDPQTP